jgi:hypothetical protein
MADARQRPRPGELEDDLGEKSVMCVWLRRWVLTVFRRPVGQPEWLNGRAHREALLIPSTVFERVSCFVDLN